MLKLMAQPEIANTMAYSIRLRIRRKNARDFGPSAAMMETKKRKHLLIFPNPPRCLYTKEGDLFIPLDFFLLISWIISIGFDNI